MAKIIKPGPLIGLRMRRGRPPEEVVIGHPLGDSESLEWEEGRQTFPKPADFGAEKTAEYTRRPDDQVAKVRKQAQLGPGGVPAPFPIPLPIKDEVPTRIIQQVFENVGWSGVAPQAQRIDSGVSGRVSLFCENIGPPGVVIWLGLGADVQAAFGVGLGFGVPLDAPTALGVWDGASMEIRIGDGTEFWVSASAGLARLVVWERMVL